MQLPAGHNVGAVWPLNFFQWASQEPQRHVVSEVPLMFRIFIVFLLSVYGLVAEHCFLYCCDLFPGDQIFQPFKKALLPPYRGFEFSCHLETRLSWTL